MNAILHIQDSITDYAVLLAALARPFARTAEVLATHNITVEQLAAARAHWVPVLRRDANSRRAYARAFSGGATETQAETEATDETVMLGMRSPLLDAPAALPFVEGVFQPAPAAALDPKVRSDADPDATQFGAALTDITLPFQKSPLRSGAK